MAIKDHIDELIRRYKDGETLKAIGSDYGCSREYIRQLLAGVGVTKTDGGAKVRSQRVRSEKTGQQEANRNRRAMQTFGCNYAHVVALNEGRLPSDPQSLAIKYVRKRINVRSEEDGAIWELTFPQFAALWEEAGLPRGNSSESGAVVRLDPSKGYVHGNVVVRPLGQHIADVRRAEAAARKR